MSKVVIEDMIDRHICKAKRTDNGEWVEGYYANVEGEHYIVLPAVEWDDDACMELPKFVKIIPETLCQYAGLTDWNDKKIFEGDIVKVDNLWTGTVIWEFNDTAFEVEPHDYTETMECLGVVVNGNIVEVIGNIFDNPELLGKREV